MNKNNIVEIVDSNYFYEVMGTETDKKVFETVKERLKTLKENYLSNEQVKNYGKQSKKYFRKVQSKLTKEEWKENEEIFYLIAILEMSLGFMTLEQLITSFPFMKEDEIAKKTKELENKITDANMKTVLFKIYQGLTETNEINMEQKESMDTWNYVISLFDYLATNISSIELNEETLQEKKRLQNYSKLYGEFLENYQKFANSYSGYRIAHLGNINIEGRESRESVNQIVNYFNEKNVDYVMISGNLLSDSINAKDERTLRVAKQIAWFQFLDKIKTKEDGTERMIFINRHGKLEPYDNGAWLSILNQGEYGKDVAADNFMELGKETGETKVEYFVPLNCQFSVSSLDAKKVLLKKYALQKGNHYGYQEVNNGNLNLYGKLDVVQFGNRWKSLKTMCNEKANWRYVPKGDLTYTVFMSKDGTDLALNDAKLPPYYEMNAFLTSYENKKTKPKIKIENLDTSKYNSQISYLSDPKKNMILNRGIQEKRGKTYIPVDIIDVIYPKQYLHNIVQRDCKEIEKQLNLKK